MPRTERPELIANCQTKRRLDATTRACIAMHAEGKVRPRDVLRVAVRVVLAEHATARTSLPTALSGGYALQRGEEDLQPSIKRRKRAWAHL